MSTKVLNLYCGLGGNRKLWQDVEVTAVDNFDKVLDVYSAYNPNDTIIEGDAHQYLLEHVDEFDFVWSSVPCQTHSKMNKATRHDTRRYPDMALYQEIIFLQHFGKDYVVENVTPYYEPLIPAHKVGRHLFWSNNLIRAHDIANPPDFTRASSTTMKQWLGIEYAGNIYYGDNHCEKQVLRNCVHPQLGKQVFDSVREGSQRSLFA